MVGGRNHAHASLSDARHHVLPPTARSCTHQSHGRVVHNARNLDTTLRSLGHTLAGMARLHRSTTIFHKTRAQRGINAPGGYLNPPAHLVALKAHSYLRLWAAPSLNGFSCCTTLHS